ncbi:DUF1289 domain-containing protein [Metapseudomonas furukawaii]|uniref:DUF1289 domain-containing protein n=1 Tax=Metapseudomonas furukawaii TaxID=1149133 RepID=UPI000560460E|nr:MULTISPECIES: DUF1289 domain-containing protein [Pseudomonas]OWJ95504.1 DUF1289 domain-containing protein [Pseudomonas sp. A46]WAG78860.1 DUF1289 domain-containing protein [Pseudomonas furukawaii]
MSSTSSDRAPPARHPSPCVRRCCLNDADVCVGCGRTLAEICEWGEASDVRRREICAAAEARRQSRAG